MRRLSTGYTFTLLMIFTASWKSLSSMSSYFILIHPCSSGEYTFRAGVPQNWTPRSNATLTLCLVDTGRPKPNPAYGLKLLVWSFRCAVLYSSGRTNTSPISRPSPSSTSNGSRPDAAQSASGGPRATAHPAPASLSARRTV